MMLLRPRVLLADDHPEIAEVLKSILSPHFDVVSVVHDGLALIHAAQHCEFDVIVADISMPRLDGLSALTLLRKHDPTLKVVFVTMYNEPSTVSLALEAGASGFVSKHDALDELVPAVRAALNGEIYVPALTSEVGQNRRAV
jgi:DNA-binding NarL/FixJ family response regulator